MARSWTTAQAFRKAVAVLSVMVLLVACGADTDTDTDTDTDGAAEPASDGNGVEEPIPVRYVIGLTPLPTGSAYYSSLPEVLGYFEDEGLDVEVELVDGGNSAVQAMAAGRADITLTAANAVLASVNQGMEGTSFCSLLTSTHIMPAALADSSVETIEDFEGQVVGVPSVANAATTLVRGLLADAGLEPDTDVSIVPIGTGGEALAAIERGNAEVFSMVDTHYAGLENQGVEFRYISAPLLEELTYNQVLTISSEFEEANPDVAGRFGRAVAKATLFAQRFPERSIELHWERYPETQPTGLEFDEAVERDLHVYNTRVDKTKVAADGEWCAASDESVENAVEFLLGQGALDEARPVSEYWTSAYIEEINDFDESTVVEPNGS